MTIDLTNAATLAANNNCIINGLPASVMRQSMENKNQLSGKGSIYAGNGSFISIGVDGDTYKVATTGALTPNGSNDDGKIIRYNSSMPLGLEIVDPSDSAAEFHSYFADNVNLSATIEQNDVTNTLDVEINCGIGEPGTFAIPLATGNGLGVVKLTNDVSCMADDTTISANTLNTILNGLPIQSNSATHSVGVGYSFSDLTKQNVVVIGNNSSVGGNGGIAIGDNASSYYTSSISIGSNSKATADGISIGNNASYAGSSQSISIGKNALSSSYGISIGYNSDSGVGVNSIAIGRNASVTSADGISIGVDASSDRGGVAIKGTAAQDGVAIRGTASARDGVAIRGTASARDGVAIGGACRANGSGAVCIGRGEANGEGSVCIGGWEAKGAYSVAIGVQSKSTGTGAYDVAIGYYAEAGGDSSVAIGEFAEASVGAVAIGSCASASTSVYGIAIGNNCTTIGTSSIVIGRDARVGSGGYSGEHAIAIGYMTNATGQDSVAFGPGASTSGYKTIQIGNSSDSSVKTYIQGLQSGSSDIRLKEDIEDANTSLCLDNVNNLKVHRYKFKNFVKGQYDVHQLGWIADELLEYYPKSVYYSDNIYPKLDENGSQIYKTEVDENGNEKEIPETFEMKDVKSINFHLTAVPVLWGAVQELTKRLEALEQENQQLKERINSL